MYSNTLYKLYSEYITQNNNYKKGFTKTNIILEFYGLKKIKKHCPIISFFYF